MAQTFSREIVLTDHVNGHKLCCEFFDNKLHGNYCIHYLYLTNNAKEKIEIKFGIYDSWISMELPVEFNDIDANEIWLRPIKQEHIKVIVTIKGSPRICQN